MDLEYSNNHEVSALILKLDERLNAASEAIKWWNKLSRNANESRSEAGLAAVDEYLFDEVASDPKRKRTSMIREPCIEKEEKCPGCKVRTDFCLVLLGFDRSFFFGVFHE